MILELHLLQSFAPSNLNRDDTGSPKDCEFGGARRARISSQCQKRAARELFRVEQLVDGDELGTRSKRIAEEVCDRLRKLDPDRDTEETLAVARRALEAVGFKHASDGKSQYLIFLAADELEKLTDAADTHWKELTSKKKLSKDTVAQIEGILASGRAVDIALFGRMLADKPERNVDGACQVAHAISTHRVAQDFDYFTAVDDLRPEETQGADMIGTIPFNAAVYYRYANTDLAQLAENLGGDLDRASSVAVAFLDAWLRATPSGKQTTFAAPNPPSLALLIARERGAWSLANAFLRPARPERDRSLLETSAEALDREWAQLSAAYGDPASHVALLTVGELPTPTLEAHRVPNVGALLDVARAGAAVAQ